MSETVLVTGGSGLIGKGIQEYLKSYSQKYVYIFLSSKDGDLRDMKEARKIFVTYKPTYVIHLAARVGGLFANMNYPVDFYRDNVLMNDVIMELSKEYKVKKLISCLSTCIFPDGDYIKYPIDETMLHIGPPHPSNQAYSYAKRNVDIMNRSYHSQYNCNFTSIIPTNIYGKYDNFNLENGHVLPSLIHKAYLAKMNNTDFEVFGSGKPMRQFIYNEDLAELIIYLLNNYDDSPEPIILSVDEDDEISIKDLALFIADNFGIEHDRIKFDTTKADGQYKKTASNLKLRKLLPDYKFTKIEDGISATCKWFCENYDTLRK